ncbi:transglutaminase [Fibrella sp. USSR17]
MRVTAFAPLTTLCGLLGTFLPIFLCAQAPSQQPVVKFGQVTAADFQVKPAPDDTTAEAVALYESVDTRFEYRNEKITRIAYYYGRIRVNKKSGYDQATIQIPLWNQPGNAEYATAIEGQTYTLRNGQVTRQKMDKAAVVSERLSEVSNTTKFTLPGVEEGCIIEYRYTVYSPNEEVPPSWEFQHEIPVIWSDYKVTISNYFQFRGLVSGYIPLTVVERKPVSMGLIPGLNDEGGTLFHYAIANAPAFRNEPYITTPVDYVASIHFELAKIDVPGYTTKIYSLSWPDMDRLLLDKETFSGQYAKATYLRDVTEAIKTKYPVSDTLGRVTAAYDYVRTTMTWNEKGNLESDRLKKVLELKKGDAADLNFMLIGLLRNLDINANPVILSTRDHGRINEAYGLLRQFNYVVAHLTLGGKDVMLDATDRFVKPGMLPYRALNAVGRLIVPEGKSRFVSLLPAERDMEAKTCTFTITDDGETKGTLVHSYGGYGAVQARASYKRQGEEKFLADVKRKKSTWQVDKAEFTSVDDLNVSMNVKYSLSMTDVAQVAGDRIYLHPMLTEGQSENPFKQPSRQFPIDFGTPIDEAFTATYTLPDGYTADELPKPLVMNLPENAGRFVYQVQQSGKQLTVVSRITIKKPIFGAEEYMFLKEFYDKILLKQGEQVVLVKGAIAEKK